MSLIAVLLACATCYGDPQSLQTKGMNSAIWFMLGITAVVLSGLGVVFIGFIRRARRASLNQSE